MDRFAVLKRHHSNDTRFILAAEQDLAPEADTAVRLNFGVERISEHIDAPRRINLGPLGLSTVSDSVRG